MIVRPALTFLILFLLLTPVSWAQSYVRFEGASVWQSRNDQRIPGNTGTEFSIADFDKGPFFGYRLYVGHLWGDRHEVRLLYAPLEFDVSGQLSRATFFEGQNFAPGTPTKVDYKFNSYRVTYAYHFDPQGDWELALGFTAKIRDARVRLEQAGISSEKSNIGFVPLLNFQAKYNFNDEWRFRFDVDGLAAPQGRAFDAALFIERDFKPWSVFAGYRTVEGGADNDDVYSFAWVHYATVGAAIAF